MASHASAVKAHRQSLKNREHNRQFRTRLRSALKKIRTALESSKDSSDLAGVQSALRDTISLIDRMASKGIIHRNAAGRYKSRLHIRLASRTSAART